MSINGSCFRMVNNLFYMKHISFYYDRKQRHLLTKPSYNYFTAKNSLSRNMSRKTIGFLFRNDFLKQHQYITVSFKPNILVASPRKVPLTYAD